MRNAVKPGCPVVDNMIETGLNYLHFAENHPEKYQLFYDSSLVDFEEYEELQAAGAACFEVLLDQIRRGQKEGVVEMRPEEELAAVLWSGLHGIASLVRMHSGLDNEERPVVRAVSYLAGSSRDAISRMLSVILR